MMPQNGFFTGQVYHRRYSEKEHGFNYPHGFVFINVDEFKKIRFPLFFHNSFFSLLTLREKNYLGQKKSSIRDSVVSLIKKNYRHDFSGQIFILTQPSFLGFCFNPVSFYYCYEEGELTYIISEINNTPWNERHQNIFKIERDHNLFNFKKDFHVSPFFPMTHDYKWHFSHPEESLKIQMKNIDQNNDLAFEAGVTLNYKPMTVAETIKFILKYPFTGLRSLTLIYWNAFILYFIKKVTFFSHPKYKETQYEQ